MAISDHSLIIDKSYVNSLTELITMQNDLIDYARVQEIESSAIVLSAFRAGSDLVTLSFGTEVKLNVHNSRLGFRALSGMVGSSTSDRMRIADVKLLYASDRRQFFRIRTKITGEVIPVSNVSRMHFHTAQLALKSERPVKVHIEDVSLGGVQFSSPVQFEPLSYIFIRTTLAGQPLELLCCIKRIVKKEGTSFYYGCQFEQLSHAQEEMMQKIMLRLQQDRRAGHQRNR